MKKTVSSVLFALTVTFISTSAFGDYIAASYTCELKEGKKQEELQAMNTKWLKWVRENVNAEITSAVGTPVVGDFKHFLFVDSYPDLNTWAATQTALESDAASHLKNMFDEIAECKSNRLWKFEPTE